MKNDQDDDRNREQWHLDKRVPISLIGIIMVQTLAVGWFASELSGKVAANTLAIGRISATMTQQDDRVRINTTSIAVMQETGINTKEAVERIYGELEKINKKLDR